MITQINYVLKDKITGRYFVRLSDDQDRSITSNSIIDAREYPHERYAKTAASLLPDGAEFEPVPIKGTYHNH